MAEPKLIPLDVLLGNPEKASPQISPDGERLAYIAPVDGVLNVWVGSIAKGDYAPVTKDTDRGIRGYTWAHDNRHLLYIQDQGGDENWRVYRVDLETNETTDLTPFDKVQAQILSHRKKYPNDVLVAMNKDNEQLHDVYHIDLTTGEMEKIAENPGFVGWVIDADNKVRGAIAPQMDGSLIVLVRDDEASEWRPLVTFGPEDALGSGPVGFTLGGNGMYLLSSVGANAAQLVMMDIATGDTDVLASDPQYDVVGAMINPDTREPQAAIFLKDKQEFVVLDPSIKDDIDAIRNIRGGDFGIIDRDHADNTWIVAFDDDAGPVQFFSYDRSRKESTFLFDHRPDLNDYQLAPMEAFEFTSRDGLVVHGYITFPPGRDRKNLPTVLNVHGGPWARDSWGFQPEAQLFANRGYLHVQVNFRGSAGYGKEFINAGDKEWGGTMHDDLIDGVNWIVEQGYADKDNIAIYGGSYGGYAALVGATFTPDVFKCAVAICGPSALKSFIETIPPYWAPMIALFKNRVGDPETEADFLWARSPLSRVNDIKIPMLIAHGANDPRVKLAETEQIVKALEDKAIPHDLMVFDDEGHGFAKPENRLRFYAAAEKFLGEHLGGRTD